MNELDLDQITPETETPKPRNLEESQDLLAESNFNMSTLSSSKDGEDIESYIITKNKSKKRRANFFSDFLNLFSEVFSKANLKNKFLIIIALLISIITLFIKLYMFGAMLYYLIKRIKILHSFIMTRILDNKIYNYLLCIINYIFLLFGFVILFLEIFVQFKIRNKTMLTINECSLKSLILSKCLYFISLGLVPEVIFATVPFKSKKNVFLSFFKMKLEIQPYIIVILIIYTLYTIFRRSEETKKERIIEEIKNIKKIINEFTDNNIFVWNNFIEKAAIYKEEEKETKKDKIFSKQYATIENDSPLNLKKQNTLPTIRRKRRGSKDENENKTKYQKLLGKIDEENNEEGEGAKILGFIRKFNQIKTRVSSFWTDNIFVRIKKYGILVIIGFFLCSPAINGIFGYGYYVFYESDVYRCFQVELLLCFVFGFILILLTEE